METPDSTIFETTSQTFNQDVVERSKQVPVVVLLWTDQIAPAVDTKQAIDSLAQDPRYKGKVAFALNDVAADPLIAQQLRVQSLPSIRVIHEGRIVDQMDGPQGERAIRQVVDRLTMSSGELLQQELAATIESENWDAATQILQTALNEEPSNNAFRVEWADVLVQRGELEEARKVLDVIPEDTPERDRPVTRLEMSEEALGMGTLSDAAAAVANDELNLDARYRLSVLLAVNRQYSDALDQAMYVLRKNRSYRDDIGRLTMIRIMSLLPKTSETADQYRRQMFNFMH